VIFKKKDGGGVQIKNHHQIVIYVTRNDDTIRFCYKSYNNIGCDDNDEEEVDSDDDMEYTEDAINNMILEFSRD
jgi:hypothetical protein